MTTYSHADHALNGVHHPNFAQRLNKVERAKRISVRFQSKSESRPVFFRLKVAPTLSTPHACYFL